MADNQPLEQLTSRVPGPLSVVISKLMFVSFFFPPLKTYAVRHLQTTVTEPLSQQKLLMQALQVLKGHKLDPCFQITATHSGVQNCGSTCLEGIWNQAARTVESHPAMSQQYVVLRKRMVGFGLSLTKFQSHRSQKIYSAKLVLFSRLQQEFLFSLVMIKLVVIFCGVPILGVLVYFLKAFVAHQTMGVWDPRSIFMVLKDKF